MNSHPDHHHDHGLMRQSEVQHVSDRRLLGAVVLNQLLTVGQVVAGIFSGSVALLSDAAHNFNDANSLLIAYVARRVSRRRADNKYTFGYRRAEMIGALINLTLLAVIGLYLVYTGVSRLIHPVEPIGWIMAATAVVALIVDLATALLLWAMSQGSLNVRAAFVHNLVDALGSIAVLAGAAAIIWLDWYWVDPAITLLIAAYVLWQVVRMYPQAIRLLMEGTPPELDLQHVIDAVEQIDGVDSVHHLHLWQLDESHRAMEAHVVIAREDLTVMETIKARIKDHLRSEFHIRHSSLEFELDDAVPDACRGRQVIVHHD